METIGFQLDEVLDLAVQMGLDRRLSRGDGAERRRERAGLKKWRFGRSLGAATHHQQGTDDKEAGTSDR